MKTVITQEIDGKNIVIGFSKPSVDPEESRAEINILLSETQEAINVSEKLIEISDIVALASASYTAAKELPNGTEKDLKNAEYRNYLDDAKNKTETQLKPLNSALEAKQKELWQSDNVVHFEPKQGEFIITDPECEALKSQYPIAAGKALEFDSAAKTGAIIDSLKGVKYWVETAGVWEANVVTSVGMAFPSGAIAESDLSTVQRDAISLQLETARISDLTLAEKDSERLAAIEQATLQSVQLRSQYEIEGRNDPLADAQAWLAAEVVKIEAKYA